MPGHEPIHGLSNQVDETKPPSNVSGRADIVFVMDATGSMGDEIEDVKQGIMTIGNRLANRKPEPDVRFGAVFYRDVSDKEIVKVVPLSKDLNLVRNAIMDVEAVGGGDWPEHVGIGLHKALDMDWSHSSDGGTRLIYLVGDAPPQSYDDGYDVSSATRLATDMGVKVNVIGCSGLGDGVPAMEQIATTTGGSFSMFQRQQGGQYSSTRSATPHTKATTGHADSRRRSSKRIESPVVGIDLGSTTSAIGIYKNGHVEIIPNEHGERTTPTYIAFQDSGIVVGKQAVGYSNISDTAFGFKRLMGKRFNDKAVQQQLSKFPFSVTEQNRKPVILNRNGSDIQHFYPEELSAMVLRQMKTIAENHIGKEIRDAVISVPAQFSDAQRQATKDAATIAGLNLLQLVNEPTAAALAYGLDKHSEQNVLVYDLGGASLDVSLLTVDSGVFEVLATAGNSNLGGTDFDDRVADYLLDAVQKQSGVNISGDAHAMHRLRAAGVNAKHALSSELVVDLEVHDLLPGFHFKIDLSRARFEELNKDLFQSTLDSIEQVLVDSGLRTEQVDEIVFVGGSTRIPKIQELVKSLFKGKEPSRGINPDEAVAYGAAVQAGMLSGEGRSDLLVLDVAPLTLGLSSPTGEMVRLLGRNTVIPTKKSQRFSTHVDSQPHISIDIYEGEHPWAKDNLFLGDFGLGGIAPAPRGQPQIEVTFEIDSSGILNVGAENLGTGKSEKITICSNKGRLSEEQLERMIRDAEAADNRSARRSARTTTATTTEGGAADDEADDELADGEAHDELAGGEVLGRLSDMMFKSISDEL